MGLLKQIKFWMPSIIGILFLASSCAVKKPVVDDSRPQTEGQIITTITNLPEVVKANTQTKKTSHNKKHLIVYITGRPSVTQSFYSVKVGEYDNAPGDVLYTFIVYPKTNKIYYLDTRKAKYISLPVWRRQRINNLINN